MAKSPKPAATPPAYDPDAEYQVRIAFPVRVGPFEYLPRDDLKAKGSLLNQIVEEHGADAIATADLR
jgi:hypothetical protein